MSKENKYIQCKLRKGMSFQTAWIPYKFAVVGKYLRILDDNGWQVRSVGDFYVKESEVKKLQSGHRLFKDVLEGH